MKIKMHKEYKKIFTICDVERAKEIINELKDDGMTTKEWAEMAVREAIKDKDDFFERIIEATAETAKNCRTWNAYNNDSCDIDVWIEATAETAFGFVKIGAYLTDIWQTGAVDYANHMYIRYYREVKTA